MYAAIQILRAIEAQLLDADQITDFVINLTATACTELPAPVGSAIAVTAMIETAETEAVVFVIDDDALVRDSLSSLFRSVGLSVISLPTAQEFLESEWPNIPRCLVLDVRLPGISGLDFQAELIKRKIEVPIVFITGHGDIPMTVRALKSGAIDFLPKPLRDQELLDAVNAGLANDRQRRQRKSDIGGLRARLQTLSEREKEVLDGVVSGQMNKQIAASLGVSEITVKVHRGAMMRKMGAKSVADLVRIVALIGSA